MQIDDIAPQLWASQTPQLVRGYHNKGIFSTPSVEDVSAKIKAWEKADEKDLAKLGGLIREIVKVVKEKGGRAKVVYDVHEDKLTVNKLDEKEARRIPDDLYAMWKKKEDEEEEEEEGEDVKSDHSENDLTEDEEGSPDSEA